MPMREKRWNNFGVRGVEEMREKNELWDDSKNKKIWQ